MRLRDHLVAAGLAVVVMALSLTIGRSPERTPPVDRIAAAANAAAD